MGKHALDINKATFLVYNMSTKQKLPIELASQNKRQLTLESD